MIILTAENHQKRLSKDEALKFLDVTEEQLNELIETGKIISKGIRDYTVDELPEAKQPVEENDDAE